MNLIDYLLLALILLAVVGAVRRICLNRKRGKTCCGNCSMCGIRCSGK